MIYNSMQHKKNLIDDFSSVNSEHLRRKCSSSRCIISISSLSLGSERRGDEVAA